MGDISFYDLLPPNLNDAESRALSYAFDRQFEKLHAYIPITMFYADIMSAEEWVCDYLALMLDIRVYDISLPLDTKRLLIQTARQNNSKKGTATAVSNVIGAIHGGAKFIPWFAYDGEPYRFKVTVDTAERGMGIDDYDKLESSIDEYKALRSQMDGITVSSKSGRKQVISGAVVAGESVKAVPFIPDVRGDRQSKLGGASISGEAAVVYPHIESTLQSSVCTIPAGACVTGERALMLPHIPDKIIASQNVLCAGASVSGEHTIIKMMRTED